MPAEKDLLDRIKAMEVRLAALEARGISGLAGTDQTIKGSHDRLDALLGAAASGDHGALLGLGDDDHGQYVLETDHTKAAHDALAIDADTLDTYHAAGLGAHANRIRFMAAKNIADNTATSIIRVTTTNEAGDVDGGGWSALVHCLAQDGNANYGQTAARSCLVLITRSVRSAGVGVTTLSTIVTTASADSTDPAQRTITTLTVSTVEVDEYNVDIQVLIDHGGTGGTAAIYAIVAVDMLWYTFGTAPSVAAV